LADDRDEFSVADGEIDTPQHGYDVLALAVALFEATGIEERLGGVVTGMRWIDADACRGNATEGVPYSVGPWPLTPDP
jgi:hypothetical protein